MKLTDKQMLILNAIARYTDEYGMAPTYVELQELLDIPNIRSVSQHIDALEKKGYVLRGRGARSIRVRDEAGMQMTFDIPVLGFANAGRPLAYADETLLKTIRVSQKIVGSDPSKYFFVAVSGTSMNAKKVNGKILADGSYALVRRQSDMDDPDAAYLFVVESAATIKCFRRSGETVTLLPRSLDRSHAPILLSSDDAIETNGKIVDVFSFE